MRLGGLLFQHAGTLNGEPRIQRNSEPDRTGRETTAALAVEFRGKSQIVDCHGRILAAAGSDEGAVVAELDLASAKFKANAMCADFTAKWGRYA